MKRATIHLQPHPRVFGREIAERGRIEVQGYACEIEGLPFVVHRPMEKDADTGEPVIGSGGWAVSEPTTGTLIRRGYRHSTRAEVLTEAERVIERNGGRQGVLDAIEQVKELGLPAAGSHVACAGHGPRVPVGEVA